MKKLSKKSLFAITFLVMSFLILRHDTRTINDKEVTGLRVGNLYLYSHIVSQEDDRARAFCLGCNGKKIAQVL